MSKVLQGLPWFAGALIVGALFYLERDTRPLISCEFITNDGDEILPEISSGLAFYGKAELRTEGEDLDLRSVEGTLQWSNGTEQLVVAANGTLFTGIQGEVLGLSFRTNEPPKGFYSFSVATLNDDGWLDENRDTAFVSRNPVEKQMYPVTYDCEVDG